MKTHSAPYVPLTMTREQIAAYIASGFQAQTSYFAIALRRGQDGHLRPVDATPIHLRRA